MLSPTAYWLILLIASFFALLRGGREEMAASAIIIAASIATVIVHVPPPEAFRHLETGVFIVDVVALAAFVAVALMSSRYWPLWVAGFQLTSVGSHIIMAVHEDLVPRVYAAAERFWIYPILFALVAGSARTGRRARMPHVLAGSS